MNRDFASIAAWIRRQELSWSAAIDTPFGRRRVCYADLTATGRHLPVVEAWLQQVRPLYANTHTEISTTGRLMSRLRDQAREIIGGAVNAGPDDRVLFVGSGATAAINKLVGLLGLRIPEPLDRRHRLSHHIPPGQRPVVFVGPYEHHSNELPWVESIADVVEIGLDGRGHIDLDALERELERYADRQEKIGAFSAASNVTGVLTDVPALTRVLHRGGALACIDYAAAAPYVPIDMHPADPEACIDALFLSPHKFVGGPEASGVLVAHRDLFRSRIPERPGGGTVDYVARPRHDDVDYVGSLTEREEGGTPAILGDLRAGLAFQLQQLADPRVIRRHEIALASRAAERLSRHPRIRVLGPRGVERLAILPIEIEGLHHDLVSALLDHLFGIQNRAGCSCAGPYGHRLLGVAPERSARFRALVRRGIHGIKPGWARVSLPWYASEDDVEFILSAVEFVADHGDAFVPVYRFHWGDGVWRHVDAPEPPVPLELAAERWLDPAPPTASPGTTTAPDDATLHAERRDYLHQAQRIAGELEARWTASPPPWVETTGHAELDALTWFRCVHTEGLPRYDPA